MTASLVISLSNYWFTVAKAKNVLPVAPSLKKSVCRIVVRFFVVVARSSCLSLIFLKNKNFYSSLIKHYLPMWLCWQIGWYLSFQHIIDYQQTDIGLLLFVKLGTESCFFIGICFLLWRQIGERSFWNVSILILLAGIGVYTSWQWLRLLISP